MSEKGKMIMKAVSEMPAQAPGIPAVRDRCMALIGMTGVSQRLSLDASVRCPEPAVMTVTVFCQCGHGHLDRVCTLHAPDADPGPRVCADCSQQGHACPVTLTRVA